MSVTAIAPVRSIRGTATGKATVRRAPVSRETKAQREAREAAQRQAQRVMRTVAIVGASVVWINALWVSYFHICQLAIRHGSSQSSGHMLPLIIDGLMLVSSVAIVAQPAAWLPRVTFGFGALATVSANVASVQNRDVVGYLIAGVVGTALIMSAVTLERLCIPHAPKRRTRKR